MAAKGNLFTGARARFLIEGVKVGYATSVAITEEIEYQPVEVLDNIEVEEHVPVAYRVRFSARKFRIVGETLKSRGWFPATGKNTDEHLANILDAGVLSAQIEDTKTSKVISYLDQVKIASHNWTVDARGIVGEDVEFVAIRTKDESELV
jgi:hypothetical protein